MKPLKRHFRMSKPGFSLIEVLLGITVFSLVVIAAGGSFISVQDSWKKQRAAIERIQNVRWALEFMAGEISQGGNADDRGLGIVPELLRFEIDTDGDNSSDARVWYWRGNTQGANDFGRPDTLYRGVDASLLAGLRPSLIAANANRQELANFIVDNPNETPRNPYPIFEINGGLIRIWVTSQTEGRSYTLRTQVRPRN